MMKYKDYFAVVGYDEENKVLHGRVINLAKDGINFEAKAVEDLEKEFHLSVDDYLNWCKEEGREPEAPYSGKFVLRINPKSHSLAAYAASQEGVSLNKFVERAIERETAKNLH